MKRGSHPLDPRGLILEAYAIEGIVEADCRSIFFDWAMGLPVGTDPAAAAEAVRLAYAGPDDHPMTALLLEASTRGPGGRPSRRRRLRESGET
ncbi:MAG: hypothetical protein AAFT19_06630 [Pseudomonadota bacterium]